MLHGNINEYAKINSNCINTRNKISRPFSQIKTVKQSRKKED